MHWNFWLAPPSIGKNPTVTRLSVCLCYSWQVENCIALSLDSSWHPSRLHNLILPQNSLLWVFPSRPLKCGNRGLNITSAREISRQRKWIKMWNTPTFYHIKTKSLRPSPSYNRPLMIEVGCMESPCRHWSLQDVRLNEAIYGHCAVFDVRHLLSA